MGVYFGETEITNIDNLVPQAGQDITQAFFGSTEVFTVWGEYDGTLPATYSANGSMLADYRIYGSAGGVGDYVAPEYKQVHTDTVTIDGIVWDILGYDHDTVYKSDNTLAQHSVTIQAHDILSDMQFDAKEALFAFDDGLAAGTYHFTVGAQPWYSGDVNKTIQFTLSSTLPARGQLVMNNAYNATMVGATISAFASGTATTATETVTMSEGSDGTDIGTVTNGLSQDGVINSIQRAFLGSNKWSESCIRQYLNSSASAGSVWEPKNKWDRPPVWAANTAGFLNGMSAEFKTNLGTTNKTTALNNVTDGGSTGTTLDKVFLLSRSEVYAGDEVTGGEGTAYPYYSDFSDLSAPGMGADGNRVKALNGTAKPWWTRSQYVDVAYSARSSYLTGAVSNSNAAYGFGIAPACCIILDDMETNDWLREKFLKNPRTAYGYEVDMSVENWTPYASHIGQIIDMTTGDENSAVQYTTAYFNNFFPSAAVISVKADTAGGGRSLRYMPYDANQAPMLEYKAETSFARDGRTVQLSVTIPSGAAYYGVSYHNGDTQKKILATTPIYIGDTPLGEDEYVDYREQKVYRRTENYFDGYFEQGTTGGGIPQAANNRVRSNIVAAVTGAFCVDFKNGENFDVAFDFWNGTVLVEATSWMNSKSYTTPNDAISVRIKIRKSNNDLITPDEVVDFGMYPGSTLQPVDPPVPLPALPTVDGTNIVDYVGQSAAPSRFYAKYRKR